MARVKFNDVWEELKNEDEESRVAFETAEEMSRIIIALIEVRVAKGYTQRDLAAKCGLKQSAIARMESLKTVPRLDTVIRVANALDVVITFDSAPASKADREAGIERMKTYHNIQKLESVKKNALEG